MTGTRCVGTNLLQVGRYLAAACSGALALRDSPLSILSTSEKIFPCPSLLSDSLSEQEGVPGGTLSEEMSYCHRGNVLPPFALPSPTCPPRPPSPPAAEDGQQQEGFWSSSLSPPSSLTEPAGGSSGLEFPYQGRKIPPDCGNLNVPWR